MWTDQLMTALRAAPVFALALAATLLAAPTQAGAAALRPEERDLAMRVQIILKSVHI